MNITVKTVDIFILVVVSIFAPLMLFDNLHERVICSLVKAKTAEFTENASDTGKITLEEFYELQSYLTVIDASCRIEEFSVSRIMEEPEYMMKEEVFTEENEGYIFREVITELPEVEDIRPVFDYIPENEVTEYNENIKTRRHVCAACENGGLCEKARSFRPLRENVTVIQGSPIMLCGIISYSDGTEKAVVCSADADSVLPCRDKTVILSYEAGKRILECIYILNVLPDTVTCANNHTYYNRPESERECPYCAEYVDSIEICAPEEPLNIKQGSGLAENGVTVKVLYMDGHEEVLYGGFSDNLDKNYIGKQTVTVAYKTKSDAILVNNLYDADTGEEDEKESISKKPYFTGKVLIYEAEFFKESILEELFEKGEYKLKKQDYLKLEIVTGKDNSVIYGTEIRGGAS